MEKSKANVWADKHYLLIDDFSNMRQILRDILRALGVRYVDQADSGAEAIAALGRKKYDVVLCDYNLGRGRNGQQVLEEAKLRELISPSCIWMMVSAEKSVESVMGAAECQPDGYLIKPITEGVLLARLNRIWSKKQIFQAIDQAYEEKDYLKAARLCDERIKSDPVHVLELLRMKATLLQKSGEAAAARQVYEEVLAEREFPWAKTGIAKILLEQGESERASKMLQEVIDASPHYMEAYDPLATAQQQLGQLEQAEAVLQKAAELSPNSVIRQKNLGTLALRRGDIAVAEKAFKKSVEVGEYSVLRTPDAYFGLARVYGQKENEKEALKLLATVQNAFDSEEVRVRAKITEGLVYHESGNFVRARKSGDELGRLLQQTAVRPDPDTCLDMARLLFAVGIKDTPADLLSELVKNHHDDGALAGQAQQIFDKARMSEQGAQLISDAQKEAAALMDRGVMLWKDGQFDQALAWMRNARTTLPSNARILFNSAHVQIAYMQKNGTTPDLVAETREVLCQAEKLAPNQKRFAELMAQLRALETAG